MQIFLSRNRSLILYYTQELEGREDEPFLYLNFYLFISTVRIFLPFFRPQYLLWMCHRTTGACLWEGSKLKDSWQCRWLFLLQLWKEREQKVCICVYIYSLYTHTLKINIHWSFKPSAKPEKLFFVLESFLAPKAKDCLPLAAEQQQGILAAPAVAALLGGEEVGQKPVSSVCFSSSGTITEPLFPFSMALTSSPI